MGIATGVVPVGTAMVSSAVFDKAKLISDAAKGGQVLMCSETFNAVKDQGRELGLVSGEGPQHEQPALLFWR